MQKNLYAWPTFGATSAVTNPATNDDELADDWDSGNKNVTDNWDYEDEESDMSSDWDGMVNANIDKEDEKLQEDEEEDMIKSKWPHWIIESKAGLICGVEKWKITIY